MQNFPLTPGHGQMAAKKQHGFLKHKEDMSFNLPLAEKFRFAHTSEACQP
jgi:hypothetical protein